MKILSQEVNLGIGTTNVSKSTVVRIYNSSSDVGIVTTKNSSDSVIGSLTIPGSQVLYAQKNATDTLTGSSVIKVAKTAYSSVMQYASWGGGYTDGEIHTTNLAYHLDANNNSSYGGSGTTWTDLVAGSNNATINGATYTEGTGDQGYYFDFDGTNDYVEIGTPIVSGTDFTLELWCRNDAATMPSTETAFTTEGASADTTDLVRYDGNKWTVKGTSFLYARSYTVHVPQGQEWNQIVAVVYANGGNSSDIRLKIYLNGELSNTMSSLKNGGYAAGNANILGRQTPSSGFWDGQISIFRYYNAALTDANVLTNYDAHKGRYGLS
tara:strand:+ start:6567 stop:7538 length:972 start_codon:yes stop_codon:yes gene_type:complete